MKLYRGRYNSDRVLSALLICPILKFFPWFLGRALFQRKKEYAINSITTDCQKRGIVEGTGSRSSPLFSVSSGQAKSFGSYLAAGPIKSYSLRCSLQWQAPGSGISVWQQILRYQTRCLRSESAVLIQAPGRSHFPHRVILTLYW